MPFASRFVVLLLLFSGHVMAWEVGASLLHDEGRYNTNDTTRGAELRFNFGGDGPRYNDDRWSAAIGRIEPRGPGPVDKWIATPFGCCATVDELPAMKFVSVSHRWYTLSRGPIRFYGSFGLSYRDADTCVTRVIRRADLGGFCWKGTAEVSSEWAFRLSTGVRFWNAIELAFDHSSTGKVSVLNTGEDVLRLSFFASF